MDLLLIAFESLMTLEKPEITKECIALIVLGGATLVIVAIGIIAEFDYWWHRGMEQVLLRDSPDDCETEGAPMTQEEKAFIAFKASITDRRY